MKYVLKAFVIPLFLLAITEVSQAGLVTSAASNSSAGGITAGGQATSGGVFFVDVFVNDVAGGSNVLGYFNLQLQITRVSGVDNNANPLLATNGLTFVAPSSQSVAFRSDGSYVLPSGNRTTNVGFFTGLTGSGRGITIRDGLFTGLGPLDTVVPNQVTINSQQLLGRVAVQAGADLTNVDQFRVSVLGTPNVVSSRTIAGDDTGFFTPTTSPFFNVDRFGFWGSNALDSGTSYGSGANAITNNPSGLIFGSITAVPEPSSMALLGLASLGGIGARYRAWRKKKAA